MVYVIVGIALCCLTVKGYCGKKTSCYVADTGDAYFFNLLRMLFCILIGIALVFLEGVQGHLLVEGGMLAICALSGASNAAFLVGWLLAIKKNSLVAVDVGLTLGSILPAVLCALLFAEPISGAKMLGFAMIVLATAVLAGHSKETAGGGVAGAALLLLAAVGDGLSGFAQQLYKQHYTAAGSLHGELTYPKTVYHFYTYVFAAALLFLVLGMWYLRRMHAARTKAHGDGAARPRARRPQVLLHIFVMAVCMFAANYFQTVATNDYGMSSQVLYPIIKGGCLITVNVTAVLFFGERITPRSVCGSLLALGGIVSMSVL
ncbi:MAG: hypothetical protein IJW51_03265 [Clostridia bacterium]|nr:hypothetical protein [Clostridia bacterium]